MRLALVALVKAGEARRLARLGGTGRNWKTSPAARPEVILVDSSVWIEYLRAGHKQLASMLEDGIVTVHPFVIGELACGTT
ncbi:hypothetical protein [Candidatus Amarobacter glycogenicus]|uniref:hypothetical protein n=1 Tax=Candidatus Amarobacter glycogenicus TaxID=3140699 RepID=UPI0031CC7C22